jgi:hypothetical protein
MAKKWKKPAEVQGYPNAAGARLQIRLKDGRCTIKRGYQVNWTEIVEWRFA